ncbi:MAG: aspartyl protease family protein [Gemmatales bacterium]
MARRVESINRTGPLMITFQRTSFLAAIALWIGCHGVWAAPQDTKQTGKSDNRNFTEVRLTLDKSGLLNMEADVEGVKMNLILDTGCYTTVIHKSSAKKAGLKPIGKSTAAAGNASVETDRTHIGKLLLAGSSFKTQAIIMDLTEVNKNRLAAGSTFCDGLLGGDFLFEHAAVIDYQRLRIYLREPNKKPGRIGDKLKGNRTVEVSMKLDKRHCYAMKTMVEGRSTFLMLDTGATQTTLDQATAKSAKAKLEDISDSATAAGVLKRQGGAIEHFSIGSIVEKVFFTTWEMDAGNAFRKKDGEPLLSGVLGSDFLKKHAALIDYGSNTLFLRPTEIK